MNFIDPSVTDASFMENQYLSFVVNEQDYAFPISGVREIISVQSIMAVPEFPAYAKGIINVRGDVIPVIDMRLRFHMNEQTYNARTCIIIVNCGGRNIGFIVDTVSSVIDILPENISPSPRISGEAAAYITGVGKIGERIIMLLDTNRLLTDEMMEAVVSGMENV